MEGKGEKIAFLVNSLHVMDLTWDLKPFRSSSLINKIGKISSGSLIRVRCVY